MDALIFFAMAVFTTFLTAFVFRWCKFVPSPENDEPRYVRGLACLILGVFWPLTLLISSVALALFGLSIFFTWIAMPRTESPEDK